MISMRLHEKQRPEDRATARGKTAKRPVGPLGHHANAPVLEQLPAALREQARKKPYLREYLQGAVEQGVGVPRYIESLSPSVRDQKDPNLIYPVGAGLFVHIYPNPESGRDRYVAIEPCSIQDLGTLVQDVHDRLIDFAHEMREATTLKRKAEHILRALDSIVVVAKSGRTIPGLAWDRKSIAVSQGQYDALRYLLIRDLVGLGPLQALIKDPYIEDISCSGVGPLFVEHKFFNSLESNVTFDDPEKLDKFVLSLSQKIGRPVSYKDPIVDATLPDGSRINIVFGSELSRRGSNFSIRKVTEKPLSILEIIDVGTLTFEMAAYFSTVLAKECNLFICGETASGKTTLLNALTTFIDPAAKIVSIEDTPELQVPHPNWIRGVTRPGATSSEPGGVTMFDLLRASMRQRPDEIIIGEIRGEEGAVAFQAMQTGHAVMSTFHASTVEKLIQRLTGAPINVPITHIDNLNVVVIQKAVQLPDGTTARRCVSISEIVDFLPRERSFSYQEIFRWDPATDTFEFNPNSHLLEGDIASVPGQPLQRQRAVYEKLRRQAAFLRGLHHRGVTGFQELFSALSRSMT